MEFASAIFIPGWYACCLCSFHWIAIFILPKLTKNGMHLSFLTKIMRMEIFCQVYHYQANPCPKENKIEKRKVEIAICFRYGSNSSSGLLLTA